MKTKLALEFAMQEVTKVGHTARTQKLITCATLGRVAMLILLLGVFATSSHAQDPQSNACDLLNDETQRTRMSAALERKLHFLCDEADLGQFIAPPQKKTGPSILNGKKTVALLISDPAADNSLSGRGTTQSETTIVSVGGTICAAWNDSGSYFLGSTSNGTFSGYGFSQDKGRTWTDAGPFPIGTGGDRNFGDPSLAYSMRDGAIYYAALSDLGLSLWRSTDKCRTFAYVGPIHVGFGDDKELIAVDNNPGSPFYGRIYVGYTDFDPNRNVNTTQYSDDGGITWSVPVDLAGTTTRAIGMWPAVAPNGDVYFALLNRTNFVPGNQNQWIFGSTDGGNTWTKLTDIAPPHLAPYNLASTINCGRQALNGDIRNLSSPQIAITKDETAEAGYVIHAVYPYDSDGVGSNTDESNVFYRRSTDGAQTWSAEVKLNDDTTNTDQYGPVLGVIDEEDKKFVFVSWYDRRLDTANNLAFDRYAVVSTDGGLSWGSNIRVSDVSSPVAAPLNPNFDGVVARCYHGDYDQLATDPGNVAHIIWSGDQRITVSGPNPDIYFRSIMINPSVASR